MKKSLFAVSLTILMLVSIFCSGCSSNQPRKHYEKSGGFSYDPPDGWQIVEFPGLKYRISHGPAENGFAPNINVVDEIFDGTLEAYVQANQDNMEKIFKNISILTSEKFLTEDGSQAIRLITKNEQQGTILRQTFYFFGSSKRKYVATCSALADGGESLDSVFAKSMRAFRIH